MFEGVLNCMNYKILWKLQFKLKFLIWKAQCSNLFENVLDGFITSQTALRLLPHWPFSAVIGFILGICIAYEPLAGYEF